MDDTQTTQPVAQMTLPEVGLEQLFGPRDQNLKRIERAFGVRLAARGSDLRIDGEPATVAAAERLIAQLAELARRGMRFRQQDIATALRVALQAPEQSLIDFFEPKDEALAAVRRLVQPRGLNQFLYLKSMVEHDIVISIGPAGTGKTFLAVAMAAVALVEKKVRRIVLARPAVEAGEKLGFLPGDLADKVNPYLRPLYDALHDLVGFDKVSRLMERGVIEVAPLAFMRGRTLNESFIILDEAQNTTSEQMKMLLTRIGYGSQAVINGDVTQIDLARGLVSGLRETETILAGVEGIRFVYFDKADVVRHPLVGEIVAAYDAWDESRRQGVAELSR